MKRLLDITVALLGLTILSPLLLVLCVLIWLQDHHSPFYVPSRVGRGQKPYRMIKLRSMVTHADLSKVDSTSDSDPRITIIGRTIRRCKFDEIPQLWNVLVGDMSLVGPRPNVSRETDLYTAEEKRLLSVRPGITDISSIVFSDEGNILKGESDPDIAYNQLIRPYKSRLGLLYIDHSGALLDIQLVVLTLLSAVSRRKALALISVLVEKLGAPRDLIAVSARQSQLQPAPPPGATSIVYTRQI